MRAKNKLGVSLIWVFAGIIYLSISASACKKDNSSQPASSNILTTGDSAVSILFVGNSLTFTNNLPAILTRIGKDSGIKINTTMIAHPNYALEDHWNDGQVQALIESGKFHFVIIQQGPSSQADGRAMLFEYGARIKALCDRHNARLAFFLVWPAFSNFQSFDGVIKNYTDAAAATGSLLCPVGLLWKKYFSETGDYSYYGPDMFHPSVKGTESAARIIMETLFRH